MGTELMCRQNITVKGLAIVNGLIPRPEVHLLRAVPSPTAIRLRGARTGPIACLRSFRLRWWSGWHRGVLRGFAGWGVVLLALSAKRPCLLSRYQHMGTELMCRQNITVKGLAIVNGLIPRPEVHLLRAVPSPTAIRLRGARTGPIACLRSFRLRWWSGWHRGVLRGFAGWGVVLLALLGRPPCPQSKCQDTRTRLV